MKKLYRCTQCLLTNQKTFMKPAIAFGANSAAEVSTCIHRHGAWTRCLTCQEVASSRRGCEKTPDMQCVDPNGMLCAHCHLRRPIHYYDKSAQRNRKVQKKQCCNACRGTLLCADCAEWKPKTEFRDGADSCKTCQTIPCAACGDNKLQTQYEQWDIRNFFHHKIDVLCQKCRGKGVKKKDSQRTHKREHQRRDRQCCKCKEYHNLSAFRRQKGGRVDVCRSCELVQCGACAAMLPQSNFKRQDLHLHFQSAQQITCLACRDQQNT